MIRRILTVLFTLCALGFHASAQDLPAVYDVTGVAANDVLNVRADPSAGADILGKLPPDAKGIEVIALSDDGKWGMVAAGEGTGWVSLRFLKLAAAGDPALLPRPLACLGTEPFWYLALTAKGAEWEVPGEAPQSLTPVTEKTAPEGYFLTAQGPGGQDAYHLTVTRETCSDGMSDRSFGFTARLFRTTSAGNSLLRGCCTLEQR